MNWEMLEDAELSALFDLLPENIQEGILGYMYEYVINEDDEVIQITRMDLRDALYAYTEINSQAEKSINSRVEVFRK